MSTFTMPRQDSLADQMFDVVNQAAVQQLPVASRWLFTEFFTPLTDVDIPVCDHVTRIAELRRADRIAIELGCYDASDWIRRQILEDDAVEFIAE